MKKVVLASGNKGKLKEFDAMFSNSSFDVCPQSDFDVIDAEETGLTFVENAILKARNAALQTQLPAIADDSGLEVDALNGQPGIYSARYSQDIHGDATTDKTNNKKLLEALAGIEESKRTARFICSLVFMRHAEDPTPCICIGKWEGIILFEESGGNGFGYDPLFYLPELACTSAELEPSKKNQISHRGQAMQQLTIELKKYDYL